MRPWPRRRPTGRRRSPSADFTGSRSRSAICRICSSARRWGRRSSSMRPLQAGAGDTDRMDLLSVVLHELGHALGLDHDDGSLMAETLAPGEQRVVEVAASSTTATASTTTSNSLTATTTTATTTRRPAGRRRRRRLPRRGRSWSRRAPNTGSRSPSGAPTSSSRRETAVRIFAAVWISPFVGGARQGACGSRSSSVRGGTPPANRAVLGPEVAFNQDLRRVSAAADRG